MRAALMVFIWMSAAVAFAQPVSNELLTVRACSQYLKMSEFKNPSLDQVSGVSVAHTGKSEEVNLILNQVELYLAPNSTQTVKANCVVHSWFTTAGATTQCDQCDGQPNCACADLACTIPGGGQIVR